MLIIHDYWHPNHKFQLVNWFVSNNILTYSKANKMSLKNLYGKYKEIREKQSKILNTGSYIEKDNYCEN